MEDTLNLEVVDGNNKLTNRGAGQKRDHKVNYIFYYNLI